MNETINNAGGVENINPERGFSMSENGGANPPVEPVSHAATVPADSPATAAPDGFAVWNDITTRAGVPDSISNWGSDQWCDALMALVNTPLSLGQGPEITFGHALVLLVAFWAITGAIKTMLYALGAPIRFLRRPRKVREDD